MKWKSSLKAIGFLEAPPSLIRVIQQDTAGHYPEAVFPRYDEIEDPCQAVEAENKASSRLPVLYVDHALALLETID